MNKKVVVAGILGVTLGMLIFGLIAFTTAPAMMIVEDTSPLGYEETIQTIMDAAVDRGWKVATIHSLDEAVAKAGYEVFPVSVIELCHPDLSAKILQNDEDRIVISMMPCRLSVYQTSDGRVVISRMNTSLVSRIFGGNVARVMAEATVETEQILAAVLQ